MSLSESALERLSKDDMVPDEVSSDAEVLGVYTRASPEGSQENDREETGESTEIVRYEYEGKTYEVEYIENDGDDEVRYQTFPVDQGFVFDVIGRFSNMKEVAEKLASEVNIIKTEGHDGGDTEEPTKLNIRYEYEGENYELRYTESNDSSGTQNGEFMYSDFPKDPDFLKRKIKEAKEKDKFRNEGRGEISVMTEEALLLGGGVVVSFILLLLVGLFFPVVRLILGWMIPVDLSVFAGEATVVISMGLAVAIGDRKYSSAMSESKGLRYPLIVGIEAIGAALALIVVLNLPGWQVFLLIGAATSVWSFRLTLLIKNWRMSLIARKKAMWNIMQETGLKQEYIRKHGMEKYIPRTDSLLSESSYRNIRRFVFSFGFSGAVMWTTISLFLTLSDVEVNLFGLRGDSLFLSGFAVIAVTSTVAAATVPLDRILTDGGVLGYENNTQRIEETHNRFPETEKSAEYRRIEEDIWYTE